MSVKNNQPTLRQTIDKTYPSHQRVFPPLQPTPTRSRTLETNKGIPESRTLESRPAAAEDVGFPFAAQVALLTRQHVGRKDETVGLITDLTPEQLHPEQWLKANPRVWGIENGTHQRLDVSLTEDRCRVRSTNALNEAATRRGKAGVPRPEAPSRTAKAFGDFMASQHLASCAVSGRHSGRPGQRTEQPIIQHDHA